MIDDEQHNTTHHENWGFTIITVDTMFISILRFEPVAMGCGVLLVFTFVALLVLPMSLRLALLITLMFAHKQLERDRWALVRTHQWRWVRHVYQCLSIYHFAWRLDCATKTLPVPKDALKLHPSGSHILKEILQTGPQTFQSKPTNRLQIESLMECVCSLVPGIVHQSGGATPLAGVGRWSRRGLVYACGIRRTGSQSGSGRTG
jgi:hypothetical protein